MKDQDILSKVDHTLLRPTAAWVEIDELCREAIAYNTASVCIPPTYVGRVHREFPELTVCTVIGFPLGYNSSAVKAYETSLAIEDGAEEVDMVINQAALKSGDLDAVAEDIAAVRRASQGKILKVIVETCYLTEDEKIELCAIVSESGADFIKTSTGFGTGGATFADVELFRRECSDQLRIKAAGGVKTMEDLVRFLGIGASRIGTSSAVKILAGGASVVTY